MTLVDLIVQAAPDSTLAQNFAAALDGAQSPADISSFLQANNVTASDQECTTLFSRRSKESFVAKFPY